VLEPLGFGLLGVLGLVALYFRVGVLGCLVRFLGRLGLLGLGVVAHTSRSVVALLRTPLRAAPPLGKPGSTTGV
jgi:hypothetical protein